MVWQKYNFAVARVMAKIHTSQKRNAIFRHPVGRAPRQKKKRKDPKMYYSYVLLRQRMHAYMTLI